MLCCYFIFFILFACSLKWSSPTYVNKLQSKPSKVRFYPKRSLFKKSDLIDRGCVIFLKECPGVYKTSVVCARHYDGKYRTFSNYCELEYENCNSWRQWSMIKRSRCF